MTFSSTFSPVDGFDQHDNSRISPDVPSVYFNLPFEGEIEVREDGLVELSINCYRDDKEPLFYLKSHLKATYDSGRIIGHINGYCFKSYEGYYYFNHTRINEKVHIGEDGDPIVLRIRPKHDDQREWNAYLHVTDVLVDDQEFKDVDQKLSFGTHKINGWIKGKAVPVPPAEIK